MSSSVNVMDMLKGVTDALKDTWVVKHAAVGVPPSRSQEKEREYDAAVNGLRTMVLERRAIFGIQPSQHLREVFGAPENFAKPEHLDLQKIAGNLQKFAGNYINVLLAGSLVGVAGTRPKLTVVNVSALGLALLGPPELFEVVRKLNLEPVGGKWARFTPL